MKKATLNSTDIPTALPGSEDDDAREKLLLEASSTELADPDDDEISDVEETIPKMHKRGRKIIKTFVAFAVFLCVLIVGIAWFFGMGWFSKPKTQVVNRTGKQETQAGPATEDEKLKMAINMISPPASSVSVPKATEQAPVETPRVPDMKTETGSDSPKTGPDQVSFSLTQGAETPTSKVATSEPSKVAAPESEKRSLSSMADPDDARGRSLFFGVLKKQAKQDEAPKPTNSVNSPNQIEAANAERAELHRSAQIPFGTLLPVRLVGSIYTLRNSGGFVRMELTRPVEGKGFSYPAGTIIVGNVRGGESVRAFVAIIGLIDPVSGKLVKFSGDLLGRDGSSGIEGKKRRLTSQWARFFNGLKETTSSVLGSVGALRAGGTVILSEPIRRGSESMSEDLSDAVLGNDKVDTFIEVLAGAPGYVLVTDLPKSSSEANADLKMEGSKNDPS